MNSMTIISSTLIIIGAIIMAFNIWSFHQVTVMFKVISYKEYESIKSLLWFHRLLIVSFLGGYLLVLLALHSTTISLGNLFVSLIFMFGAVFVLLAILIQKKMIKKLGNRYQESLETNGRLIEQQKILSKTNEQLTKEIEYRKKMEIQLIQSEKMMSVGGLAAGMAHEINNPLAGMMQSAQVIYNRLTQGVEVNKQIAHKLGTDIIKIEKFMEKRGILKQLHNISNAGEQAAKIVNNMLSFAKKNELNRSENRLDELIDKTIELAENDYNLRKNYDFRQIKIIRKYQDDVFPVACEQSKIQQVLLNIIKNASDAMWEYKGSSSPTITFSLRNESENSVTIEIEDNGPGMDHQTQKRIFEPFFSTKTVDNGTGLGLSIAYFIIVNDHGGALQVESNVGKGTKFIINLPIKAISYKLNE